MYCHRMLFDDVVMHIEEKLEEDRTKGYLFPSEGEIEILGVTEEQRIYLGFMRCIIVVCIQYRFKVDDSPLFETTDGDLM